MIRSYRYPLLPNATQTATLERWRVACQQLYNGALEERRNGWRTFGKTQKFNYFTQAAELTELRATDETWKDIPVRVTRSALRRLERSFQAFFRRVKAKQTPGFPRFRARDRYDSFGVGRVSVKIDRVHLPKIGWVRFKLYRPLKGMIRNVELRKDARGRWFVCFSCDLGEAPLKVAVRNVVGIDVGLKSFATLSNGGVVENPRFFAAGSALLTRRQQSLERKRRGSRSRQRAKRLVARAYERIRNRRLDFARKLSAKLCRDYDLIAHEDLNIKGLASSVLSKSIHDAAWGQFLRCLAFKAEEAGKHVIAVDPRGTTQRCSRCDADVPKDLSVRTHICDQCGYTADRDLNAAENILALGRSAVAQVNLGAEDLGN